ncbi:MAG: chromosomal replication initiator protein DnaA [Pyrinomonadaceae bacterium]
MSTSVQEIETLTVWDLIVGKLEQHLNPQIIDVWFKPVRLLDVDNDSRVIHLESKKINRDWISKHYTETINQIVEELHLPEYRIEWEITSENRKTETLAPQFDEPTRQQNSNRRNESVATKRENPDLDFIGESLIPKYSFESFVVGSCNELAHAAAEAVVESPGMAYNPLYIYGGVGLGKTHLMHATGNAIKRRNKHLRIAYISAEKFMNELINSIRFERTQSFRDKYRSADVLLMDDIQFMAGKERTQEEFFHTFNALYNDQKQIIISSDTQPKEIPTLEERLHSRFEWGLIADMEPPDLETKVAILKRKADANGYEIPDEIAFYIANSVRSNIRELEGSLVRLIAISSLRGLPISKMLAQDALKAIVDKNDAGSLTIERITRTVANEFGLSVDEIKSKNNTRRIALPRQVAMYLCKRLTRHSFPEIGREFGGKHHTTVMHSVEKIETLVKEERDFHKKISGLIDSLCS